MPAGERLEAREKLAADDRAVAELPTVQMPGQAANQWMGLLGPVALILGALLFSLAPVLIRWLVQRRDSLAFIFPDALSLCNVLFVGNLVAAAWALVVQRPQVHGQELLKLNDADRTRVWVLGALAALHPALIFSALERSSVVRVTVLSRVEALVSTVAAVVALGRKMRRLELLGLGLIAVGVVLVLGVNLTTLQLGDFLVFAAAPVQAAIFVITRRLVHKVSIPTFVLVRNGLSAIVFFIVGTILFGVEHFAQAFAPDFLWIMLAYGLVIVMLGQSFWFFGVQSSNPRFVADLALATPILTMVGAWILLGERLQAGEVPALISILAGMVVFHVARERYIQHCSFGERTMAGG